MSPGPSENLEAALESIAKIPDERLDELLYAAGENPTLGPQAEAAVDELIAWHGASGGLFGEQPLEHAVQYAHLGKLAIAGSDREDPAPLRAAAYLAHRLMAEGKTLLYVAVGIDLAGDVKAAAKERGIDLSWPWRVSGHTIVRALAADALYAAKLTKELPEGRSRRVRWFYIRVVRAADAHADDLTELQAAIQKIAGEDDMGPAVEIVGGNIVPVIARLAEDIRALQGDSP